MTATGNQMTHFMIMILLMSLSWLIIYMPIANNEFTFCIYLIIMTVVEPFSFSEYVTKSQLPVWTIFAEKICVPTISEFKCEAAFAFEKVVTIILL